MVGQVILLELPANDDEARAVIDIGALNGRAISVDFGIGLSQSVAVLAALIPRISFERVLADANRKSPSNVAALYLDQPFTRQLDLLRLAPTLF